MKEVFQTLMAVAKGHVPGQLVIQMTDRCNARCPQCGMGVHHRFHRSSLAVDTVKGIIDAAARKGVRAVSFTGGEPLLFLDELAELIVHSGKAGIAYIRTGTNGFFMGEPRRPDFEGRVERVARTLADTPLRNFWISIDSSDPATHDAMRGFSGLVDGIARALPIFHAHGIYPSANLGINRNLTGRPLPVLGPNPDETAMAEFYHAYQASFARFYRFVADLGFTMVNACYPMSIDVATATTDLSPVYAATAEDRVVRFGRTEKALMFAALRRTVETFRSRLRIFSPTCSLYRLSQAYAGQGGKAYPCRGGIDFFFVDAQQGDTFPCGYRGGDNYGKFDGGDFPRSPDGPDCFQCDWECFRDPSELFGPLLQLTRPLDLVRALRGDRKFFRLWCSDLKYYRACDFFDGRKPMDRRRLNRFDRGRTPARGGSIDLFSLRPA